MSRGVRTIATLTLALLAACDGDIEGSGGAATTSVTTTSGGPAGPTSTSSSVSTATTSAGGGGSAPVDPCEGALFCETFEDYAGVTDLADDQELGPWRAALQADGATMNLDDTHTVSGSRALHVSIEGGVEAGGRLFADGRLPIFEGNPTHLYGRMMMYIDPNGSSVHWTFFGASGDADPNSPEAGRRATYLMSSLPQDDVNTYSFVYGLSADGGDPYHDCWFQSEGAMPTAGWTCVEFEMDSVGRHLEMSADGAATPIAVVDDHGQGCVGDVVPDDSPWYGPAVDQIYVGAWSFHPMVAPLEVWIDDLVLDTEPVACPP
jgi:hypothetical protein